MRALDEWMVCGRRMCRQGPAFYGRGSQQYLWQGRRECRYRAGDNPGALRALLFEVMLADSEAKRG